MDKEFQRPTCNKSKLWSAVARKLAETGEYAVSCPECDQNGKPPGHLQAQQEQEGNLRPQSIDLGVL